MHTRNYIESLYDPDELLALVMLHGGKVFGKQACGFYRDREKFYCEVDRLSGLGNLYINLNKLHPDVYGRAADRFEHYSQTRFTASEITWRPRLCVDLDPVRISGINSTDAELKAALELGAAIRQYIIDEWQVEIVPVHSGNGVQLVFRINEAPDSPLVAGFLKHLDEKFSNEQVKVDTSLSDLSRIVRLPGTLNCKGDHIPERPRRLSHILEVSCVA